jgi:hypothetical protein
MQVAPGTQMAPQTPQLVASLLVSMHWSPHML